MASDFTEFCCRSGGSNLNAGSRTGSSTEPGTAADLTYASGNFVQATGVFTVASGDPVADGVAVGDFASVYADGSSVTGCVAQVTARTTTTITVSSTVIAGSKPSDGTGNRTLKIGGAWAGPSGATQFPFSFIASALVKTANKHPRVNFKNDQTYSSTAGWTHNLTGVTFRGYTSAYEDSGRATIQGAATGTGYTLLVVSGANTAVENLIFTRNGDSSTGNGLQLSGGRQMARNCIVHSVRSSGFNGSGGALFIECEAHSCNQSNTASAAGFSGASATFVRCISHDNSGSNSSGFVGSCTWIQCIADTNGQHGINVSLNNFYYIGNCDFYNNGGSGISMSGSGATVIENCNFLKNGAYGLAAGTSSCYLFVSNNGFGSGTQANTSGTIDTATKTIIETGSITYGSNLTPWVDQDNGDFRINLVAAQGTGRGSYVQTAASYAGAIGYPDVGACANPGSAGGSASVNVCIANVFGGHHGVISY